MTEPTPVLDANLGVGHRRDRPAPVDDADGLLAEMDRHGVGRALVYPVLGERISALDGNDELHAWIEAGGGRLLPLWMASAAPESLRQLQALHAEDRVRAVRLHDTAPMALPLTAWLYGDLLEWLAQEGLPLWISLADSDPARLADLLAGFPRVAAVLVGAHYTHAHYLLPLLRHLPQAHLELSRYEGLCGIEDLVEQVGARRLLYGSFYPRYAMGPVLWALRRMQIGDDDLRQILSGTAARLLDLPNPGESP